jgi:AcrR family transcriptional regulator
VTGTPKRFGRPTIEQAIEISDRVLEVARRIFCERGIAGASMDEVAAACGVSKHTIYRRYPSKHALVDAVAQHDLADLARRIESVPSDLDPVEALRETSYRYFRFNSEPETASMAGFVLAEAAYSEEMRQTLHKWSRRYIAPMIAHVEAAQADNRLAAGPARRWCLLLTDLIGSNNHLYHYGDVDSFDGEADAFFADRWRIFCLAAEVS